MESDIILEGFCKAEKQHGVRYANFTGDNSSVHSTLISEVPGWGLQDKSVLTMHLNVTDLHWKTY